MTNNVPNTCTYLSCEIIYERCAINKSIDVKCYLYEKKPHFVLMTETWATTEVTSELEIDGYQLECFDRKDGRKGGGVLMYIRDDLTPIRETELERDNIEALWCKIGNTTFDVCYNSDGVTRIEFPISK